MRVAVERDVEALLLPGSRAQLPLAQQLQIYLNPFALFKDATRGTTLVRDAALRYNRAMRWILVTYMRRWLMIAAASFLAVAPAEALAAQTALFKLSAAAFAVACCIALTVTFCTAASYLLLSAPNRR